MTNLTIYEKIKNLNFTEGEKILLELKITDTQSVEEQFNNEKYIDIDFLKEDCIFNYRTKVIEDTEEIIFDKENGYWSILER